MKTIGKLKLNQLSKAELGKREMNSLKGGGIECGCGCFYSDVSSTATNGAANVAHDYKSSGCTGNGCRDGYLSWGDGTYSPSGSIMYDTVHG